MDTGECKIPCDPDNSYLSDPLRAKLIRMLEINPPSFIEECCNLIPKELKLSSFSSFLDTKYKKGRCQSSSSTRTLVVHCKECQKSPGSCICLECFLKGNHKGHHFRIAYCNNYNCDCGDTRLWKEDGFCSEHNGVDPEIEKEFDSNFIRLCKIIFSVIFEEFPFIAQNSQVYCEEIIKFVITLINMGDSMRRICVQAILNYKIMDLITSATFLNRESIDLFIDLLGHLINDKVFAKYYSMSIINNVIGFSNMALRLASSPVANNQDIRMYSMKKIIKFFFHFSWFASTEDDLKFNWEECLLEILKNFMDFYEKNQHYKVFSLSRINHFIRIFEQFVHKDRERFDKFLRDFGVFLNDIESKFMQRREFNQKKDDQKGYLCGFYIFCNNLLMLLLNYKKQKLNGEIVMSDEPFKILLENPTLNPNVSILSQETALPLILPFHSFVWQFIKYRNDFRECFNSIDGINDNNEFDKIIQKLAVLPMRLIAISSIGVTNLFVRNTDTFIKISGLIRRGSNIVLTFLPVFSFLQTMLGLIHDKEKFIISMLWCYGLLDNSDLEKDDIQFAFLFDLCCLIFDRYCLQDDMISIAKLFCMTRMKKSPISSKEIPYFLFNLKDDDSFNFVDELLKFSSRVPTPNGVNFRLTDDSDWNVILPWEELTTLKTILSNENLKNPDKLFPFPSFKPETNNLELKSILFTPALFAIEYFFIYQYISFNSSSLQIHVNFVLNLILQTSNLIEYQKVENNKIIYANTLEELISKLNGYDFNSFLNQKIGFSSGNPTSLLELMKSFSLGIYTLEHMNISINITKKPNKTADYNKAKILRQSIMNSYKEKQNKYNEYISNSTTLINECECCVCNSNDSNSFLYYPVLIYPSILFSIIQSRISQRESINKTISYRICTHPIHMECSQDDRKRCPIDRCHRNALLPKMPASFDKTLSEVKTAIPHAKKFASKVYGSQYERALVSLATELSLLEFRYRTNPNCLDDLRYNILFKNLYYIIYHSFDSKRLRRLIDTEPFQKLIHQLLQIKTYNKEIYKNMVSSIANVTKKEYIFEFLRRAALFQHYVFDDLVSVQEVFHEWDDILSSKNLTKLYLNLEYEYDGLPQFQFYDLPDNIFSLLLPPHNVDIVSKERIAICLLTGNIISLDNNNRYIFIDDYENEYFQGTFMLLMHVNGQEATVPAFFYKGRTFRQNVFYRDQFDDVDIGFMKGDIDLHISREWLDKLADVLLSGSWVDNTSQKTFSFNEFDPFF